MCCSRKKVLTLLFDPAQAGGTVGSSSNAFGGATQLTVAQMLSTSSSFSNAGGSAWYANSAIQELAKDAFDVVNNQKAMAP
jgi:hypothetical protein